MRIVLPLVLLSLTACGDGPLGGVWLFAVTPNDLTCEPSISTNVNGANINEPTQSPWTDIDEASLSPRSFAAHVAHGPKGEITLIANGSILRGEKLSGKSYEFRYELDDERIDGDEHQTGYRFAQIDREQITVIYNLTQTSANTLDGTLTTASTSVRRFEESDRWVEAVGQFSGDLPTFYVGADLNIGNETNCSGDPCFIQIASDCEGETPISATRTGFSGSADFQIDTYEG